MNNAYITNFFNKFRQQVINKNVTFEFSYSNHISLFDIMNHDKELLELEVILEIELH